MRTMLVVIAAVCWWACSGCGGVADESEPSEPLAGTDAGAPADAGCGLTFAEARLAHPYERVCQTTVYRRDAGYCTHWVPCSSF
jgi:hypothetical protein